METRRDFNPSIKDSFLHVYRPWYVVVILLSMLSGAALIAMGITMKVLDDDLSWLICHIWTGIPLFVGGFIAIIPCASKSKKCSMFYFLFMLACMVACAAGAIINGLEYWTKYWGQAKLALDNGDCTVKNGACMCTTKIGTSVGIPLEQEIMLPVSTKTCVDLKYIVRLMISTIAIDVLGFIVSLVAVFVSFASICCGPWAYIASYKKDNDPDFGRAIVHKGTINKGYH